VPLLIALHGAGADENVFVDAYGAGITPKLAGERGMLFVSPATLAFSTSPENFDALVAQLRSEYNIDTTRVYLIGHSLGAGAVARLASQRPNAIAAVVCLAGGAAVKVPNAPPILFLGAEVDPLIPAKNVEAFAAATPSGTYRLVPHEGHTMMVALGVRTGIPWLLERKR
jgi:predicted peptidase